MKRNFHSSDMDHIHLLKMRDYFAEHKGLPSYSLFQRLAGIKSKSTVSKIISRLKDDGYLETAPDSKIIPGKRFFDRPLSNNTVQAGAFTPTYSDGAETISIDEQLIKLPSRTELIRVVGDSMKDAGILEGDTVVVARCETADSGAIVVAILEDEFTIKTLRKESDCYVLEPANKAFSIIRPKNGFRIFGVVTGLFRTY